MPYRPDLAVRVVGDTDLLLPPGLSGSTVWNTRLVESKMAGLEWKPENAVVSGVLWGWASAARGLIESAGDIVDGLLQIPFFLADHHRAISTGLAGNASNVGYGFSEIEEKLDHFAFAKWMRVPRGHTNILKAKANAVYISNIERVMPNALAYYQRLCGITHPSNASIDYLYQDRTREGGAFKLTASTDLSAIKLICDEFPDALQTAMIMSSNAPLLILRVLHKFKIHPKLRVRRQMKWPSKVGPR
jgi:hypothetical protein